MPNDLDPDRPLPRLAVHIDLHAITRDFQEIKAEIALRPTRSQILQLILGVLASSSGRETDSPLEDRGFELPVPPRGTTGETCRS